MWLVIDEIAFVDFTFLTCILAVAIGFIINEFPFVNFIIKVIQFTIPMHFIIMPLSLILRTISPHYPSMSMPNPNCYFPSLLLFHLSVIFASFSFISTFSDNQPITKRGKLTFKLIVISINFFTNTLVSISISLFLNRILSIIQFI